MKELQNLREQIDEVDETILKALARRMELVEQVSQKKELSGAEVFDSERERSIFNRLFARATELNLDIRLVEKLLRNIVSHSRNVQSFRRQRFQNPELVNVEKVSYQGSKGSYSWKAIKRHYNHSVSSSGCTTFEEAIDLLVKKQVDRALLPIQNSIAGSIHEVYELLSEKDVFVVGEERIHIDHCLIGAAGVELASIRNIYSHPVALRQCNTFLRGLKNVDCHSYIDTADAVIKVSEDQDPTQAAIASEDAAEIYKLDVLKSGISDYPDNYTRFWIVSRKSYSPEIHIPSKTSLILVTGHKEGALVECLTILADNGVNMLKLESRSRKGLPWEYQFYIDLEGNIAEDKIRDALVKLEDKALHMKILGCYPRVDT